MKKKPTSIIIRGIANPLLILLLSLMIIPVYASVPSEPHNADAMWVEPSSITFTPANATVGQKFNVTVWLNITSANVFSHSIGLRYNRTQLKGVRGGFTSPPGSEFMKPNATTPAGPIIDTSYLGNGTVLATETCSGEDFIPTPRVGSLIWIEFEILLMPTEGEYTSKFDITRDYPGDTWVFDQNLNPIEITTHDGNYTIIPEFSNLIILLMFFAFTLFALAFEKKRIRKLKFV